MTVADDRRCTFADRSKVASIKTVALAFLIVTTVPGLAAADCVAGLAYCAAECDQQAKPQSPDRPQCARGCVTTYQSCARIELLQSNTGGPALNQGKAVAPAQ